MSRRCVVKARGKDTVKWAVDRSSRFISKRSRVHHRIWPVSRSRDVMKGTARNSSATNRNWRTDIIRRHIARAGDEHRHRRRHVGTRNCTPLHGRELCRLPFVVQRRAGFAVRAIGRGYGQIKGFVNWRLDGLQRTIRRRSAADIRIRCAAPRPMNSTIAMKARITDRPGICASICRSTAC